MFIAVGNVSLDDCAILTSSLGWTGLLLPSSPPTSCMARLLITSLMFMFDWVPDPVCQTYSGKWSSSLPAITSSQTRAMRSLCDSPGCQQVWGIGRVSVGLLCPLEHPQCRKQGYGDRPRNYRRPGRCVHEARCQQRLDHVDANHNQARVDNRFRPYPLWLHEVAAPPIGGSMIAL